MTLTLARTETTWLCKSNRRLVFCFLNGRPTRRHKHSTMAPSTFQSQINNTIGVWFLLLKLDVIWLIPFVLTQYIKGFSKSSMVTCEQVPCWSKRTTVSWRSAWAGSKPIEAMEQASFPKNKVGWRNSSVFESLRWSQCPQWEAYNCLKFQLQGTKCPCLASVGIF